VPVTNVSEDVFPQFLARCVWKVSAIHAQWQGSAVCYDHDDGSDHDDGAGQHSVRNLAWISVSTSGVKVCMEVLCQARGAL